MIQENYQKFVAISKEVSEVWTSLSKEYGWPHRKKPEDLMREAKAIRSAIRYGTKPESKSISNEEKKYLKEL
jgi:hypothetical protein